MKIKFWGTRGSIPAPGRKTTKYGGNTACVEIREGDLLLILDAGSGIRELGLSLIEEFGDRPITGHIMISHTHWDHIQGFPFFRPVYDPKNSFTIYGIYGLSNNLEKILSGQMEYEYFPLDLKELPTELKFVGLKDEEIEIAPAKIKYFFLNHPGLTLGFKIKIGEIEVVYATDNESYLAIYERRMKDWGEKLDQFVESLDQKFVRFIEGAHLFISDGQYTKAEYEKRRTWGHMRVEDACKFAVAGNVKRLCIFHHDPMHTDRMIDEMVEEAQTVLKNSGIECFGAQEGMEIVL
jgi:phosphoribosyl 1,2-cyclic phosphodiesterase